QRDDARDDREQPPGVGLERQPVPLDDLLLGADGPVARREEPDDQQVRVQDGEERSPEDETEGDFGPKDRPEDLAEADLSEPQQIDEEPGQRSEARKEQHQRDPGDDQPSPAATGLDDARHTRPFGSGNASAYHRGSGRADAVKIRSPGSPTHPGT